MQNKRRLNVASVWIVAIFGLIALTLTVTLGMVYQYISRNELRQTMREQVTVLADNFDKLLVDVVENQLPQRLAAMDADNELAARLAGWHDMDTNDTRAFCQMTVVLSAAFSQIDRIDAYFPSRSAVLGSRGVRFLTDKKYTGKMTGYEYMQQETSLGWSRRDTLVDGVQTALITYTRRYPGVYALTDAPVLSMSVEESRFHEQLRQAMRTLREGDEIVLTRMNGEVFTARDPSLIGQTLPAADPAMPVMTLPGNTRAYLSESVAASGAWRYVLLRADGALPSVGSVPLVFQALCVLALLGGLMLVLRVMMKHYMRPMQHLAHRLSIPAEEAGRLSSPSETFTRIETALDDMSERHRQRDKFLSESRPVLRDFYLNCLMRDEARYTAPQPHLGVAFPHPYLQVVIASRTLTEQERRQLLAPFDKESWQITQFESREKECVLLFNHGFDENELPRLLAEGQPETGDEFVLGVGVRVPRADAVGPSFRCARRALTDRYFDNHRCVCMFNPEAPHTSMDSAMTQVVTGLNALSSAIRNRSTQEIDTQIDGLIALIRQIHPYLNTMRSIMMLAASTLLKAVYDMRGAPEKVFGDNLTDTYYHIGEISAFELRLRADSARLRGFLDAESSASTHSVVQYAIHHIRACAPAELSIQSVADSLSISTGHLSRIFHQETGQKLVDYMQQVRMEHACRLLREGKLTNEQICETLGYSRVQYFNAKFKDRWGVTLSEYRRQLSADADLPPHTRA